MWKDAVLVVREENGTLHDTGNLGTILGTSGNMKIAFLTVFGNDDPPWKTFVLNSMMSFLECEGGGWFGNSWKNRTRNLFHGHKEDPLSNGIYVLSSPFLVEDSKGEVSAIFLADIVADSAEIQTGLLAAAGRISSTLICTSATGIEEPTVSSLSQLWKHQTNLSPSKMTFQQFVILCFDSPPEFGFGTGDKLPPPYNRLFQNEAIQDIFQKVKTECCRLPEQSLDTNVAGKDFVRHFQKLLSSSILDFDDMHWDSIQEGFVKMESLNNFLRLGVGRLGKTKPNQEENSPVPANGAEILDMSDEVIAEAHAQCPDGGHGQFGGALTKSKVLESALTDSAAGGLSANLSNETKQPSSIPSSGTDDPEFRELVKGSQTKHANWLIIQPCSPATHQSVDAWHSEFVENEINDLEERYQKAGKNWTSEHALFLMGRLRKTYEEAYMEKMKRTEHRNLELEKNSSTSPQKSLANQEKDDLLQSFVTQLNGEYLGWLKGSGNSTLEDAITLHSALESRFEARCAEIGVSNDDGRRRIFSLGLQRMRQGAMFKGTKSEFQNGTSVTRETAPAATPQKNPAAQQYISNVVQNYRREMASLSANEAPFSEIMNRHHNFLEKELEKFTKFCKSDLCMSDEEIANHKEGFDVFAQEFANVELQWNKNQAEFALLKSKIETQVGRYTRGMEEEVKRSFQTSSLFPPEQLKRSHENVSKQILSSLPSESYSFLQKLKKEMQDSFQTIQKPLHGFMKYSAEMIRYLEMYTCLSPGKFEEFSVKIQKTLPDVQDPHLTSAISFAQALNKEVQEHELQLASFAIIEVKNYYNQEMKRRLESNMYTSGDLKKMHEGLKDDCARALTRACSFHEHSGIPNQSPRLLEDLDKCFTSHSSSNDSKWEKSIGNINKAIRTCKTKYVESMAQKLDGAPPFSPKDFNALHEENFRTVSKLLEIEMKLGPHEKLSHHLDTLRKRIELDLVEFRTENQKKWDEKMKKEKIERDEAKIAQNKREAEIKIRQKEEKDRKDALELEEKMKMKAAPKNPNPPQPGPCPRSYADVTKPSVHPPPQTTTGTRKSEKVEENFAIGIEFGAREVRAAVISEGRLDQIPNEWGHQETPTVIGFTDSKFLVGKPVESADHLQLRRFNLDFYWNTISKEGDEIPNINFRDKPLHLRKELLYALILSNVKSNAEKYLNRAVNAAAITVPLWYNSKQRLQVKNAGLIAGFGEVRLINETTAVALACAMNQVRSNRASDLLVVVKNEGHCDAAVYSYSNTSSVDIRMLSNCVDNPHESEWALKRYAEKVRRYLMQQSRTNIAVNMVLDLTKDKRGGALQVHEAIGVRNGPQKSDFDMSKYGNWRSIQQQPRPSSAILIGAAHFANRVASKPSPVKDLSTRLIRAIEAGAKDRQLFPSQITIPHTQNLSFGKKNSLEIQLLEGDECIGNVKVDRLATADPVELGITFKLSQDGILSVEGYRFGNLPGTLQGNCIADFEDIKNVEFVYFQECVTFLSKSGGD